MIIPISIWPAHMMNCFLIKGDNGHILVDTGIPGSADKIIEAIHNAGLDPHDIKLIVVTHSHIDHFGSVAALKKRLKIPVLAHAEDTPFYQKGMANVASMKPTIAWAILFKKMVKDLKTHPFTPDIVMKEGSYSLADWIGGTQVIHTPGHTPGSLSIVLDNGEAIIMDMMAAGIGLGGVLFHSRVKHPAFHDNLSALKKSFDKVLSLDINKFYLGHGKPVNRTQVLKYVDRYL